MLLAAAAADIHFVPVPKVTGFAAYWENDMTRTTPHPQVRQCWSGAAVLLVGSELWRCYTDLGDVGEQEALPLGQLWHTVLLQLGCWGG